MSNYVKDDDLENIRQIFFEECAEQLSLLEEELSSLEETAEVSEKINTIFRAVHSIKGGAGAFGMEKLVRFSHLFEAVLEKFRSGECVVNSVSIATFLKAADVLTDIVSFYRDGTDLSVQDNVSEELNGYLEKIEKYNDNSEGINSFCFSPIKINLEEENTFYIQIIPEFIFYENGDDIRNILFFLEKKGTIVVEINSLNIPCLDTFETNKTYSIWNVEIKTTYDKSEVEEIFAWSGNSIKVNFLDYEKFLEEKNKDYTFFNEGKKEPILGKSLQISHKENATIRIDTKRVDSLVDLLSEIVINQGAIRAQMKINDIRPGSPLDIAISDLEQLTHELQENVMAMRAHPIKMVFQRMGRIVRETTRVANKQVALHLEGEDTEVDRSILEKLSDPLTHMVRNAIDHGLESTDIRTISGKSSEGNLFLRAFHRSGRIIIEVEDDGSGLNCDKIYRKAISKGIINSKSIMEKEEIQNLIFSPGFSTVESVSDISGRGVGMDVVKKSISDMGGRISISSEKNEGTLFSISLPLTLSVVEGLIFRSQNQNFIVPVSSVVEALLFQKNKIFEISQGIWGYLYRDQYIPIFYSGKVINKDFINGYNNSCIIVENEKREKIALIVDEIIDQSRFVVKSIEKNYKKVSEFSSATILGDGEVALIVDVDFLIEIFSSKNYNKLSNFGE
ncbi:chemotaxis protein CheA [Gluconobacter japonicus]|uniref:chemotaxis protein CheA n=1 Tax=Gluconobacter japonicus TaxID=376620 RepID=UPI000784C221|nr:chemotaxis protein CheA [Gluconobacter japonicus]KXV21616.1 chemotaxis protein CheA [Gluconobacter japonicus]